jgi:hypothetical protein
MGGQHPLYDRFRFSQGGKMGTRPSRIYLALTLILILFLSACRPRKAWSGTYSPNSIL